MATIESLAADHIALAMVLLKHKPEGIDLEGRAETAERWVELIIYRLLFSSTTFFVCTIERQYRNARRLKFMVSAFQPIAATVPRYAS